jgi:hypothetical protein
MVETAASIVETAAPGTVPAASIVDEALETAQPAVKPLAAVVAQLSDFALGLAEPALELLNPILGTAPVDGPAASLASLGAGSLGAFWPAPPIALAALEGAAETLTPPPAFGPAALDLQGPSALLPVRLLADDLSEAASSLTYGTSTVSGTNPEAALSANALTAGPRTTGSLEPYSAAQPSRVSTGHSLAPGGGSSAFVWAALAGILVLLAARYGPRVAAAAATLRSPLFVSSLERPG